MAFDRQGFLSSDQGDDEEMTFDLIQASQVVFQGSKRSIHDELRRILEEHCFALCIGSSLLDSMFLKEAPFQAGRFTL